MYNVLFKTDVFNTASVKWLLTKKWQNVKVTNKIKFAWRDVSTTTLQLDDVFVLNILSI